MRPRQDADLPACVAALATVHEADRYPARWPDDPQAWLTWPEMLGAWVVAADGGTVLAHVALTRPTAEFAQTFHRPACELAAISRLFVAVPARGAGWARALLSHAAQAATAAGLQPVLEVESGASAAIALYERNGWRHVASTTASWIAPNGRPAVLRAYTIPVDHHARPGR
ncbi:MAG: GNAT family N-acetyltransferase [Catenulispora sp.]|nr:GNAT family N-acetyltransferase [Catenulispora sp.]